MRNSVVAALACVVLIAPALWAGPELPISSAVPQRAAFEQRGAKIATDGTNFLVAWFDERMPDVPLYVTLLGPDGKPFDNAPIRLPNAQVDLSGHYLVTWTGNVYLVLWTDYEHRTVRWARLGRDGRVLDKQPREIAGITTPHSIASVGGRSLIVFTDDWPDTRIHGQFIEADGTAIGARIFFPRGGRSEWAPQVATNGDSFYVVWTRLLASRVDVIGIPVSLAGELGTERRFGDGQNVHLASNGEHYLLAYTSTSGMNPIITEQLDSAGATLARTTHATAWLYAIQALAPFGSGYLLATVEKNTVDARVLDAAGRETGRLPLDASATSVTAMAIAAHATAAIAVWNEESDLLPSGSDVFSEVVDDRRDREVVSRSAARQTAIRIATNGNGFLGAWLESRQRSELRVGRVSASGVPLDGEGILIADNVSAPPAITFDGANYVLAWIEEKTSGACAVRLTRVTHEGLNLDGAGKLVSQNCSVAIGLGSNGRESLLVRSSWENDPVRNRPIPKLLANRLERDLTLGDAVELPASDLRGFDITIDSIPGMWLVAWTRYYDTADCGLCNPPLPASQHVDAVRLSDQMALLDTTALHLGPTGGDRAPSVAASGDEFLVVWERLATRTTIIARRVPRFGVPLDEQVVTTGRAPSVVAHADRFVIAFEEDDDLFTTTLGTPGRAPIATSVDREYGVRVVSTEKGLTAAYLRVASEPLYNFVDRGFLRMLDSTPRRRAIRK
jgi:hypothetical protein